MGILSQMKRASGENPATPISQIDSEWFGDAFGAPHSGVRVTEQTALGVSAVYSCVRVLSETIASLPINIFQRNGRNRDPVDSHPLLDTLKVAPNDEMTSFAWRETSQGHVSLWGNAYSEINRARNGRVSLYPLPPSRVSTDRTKSGQLVYVLTAKNGTTDTYRPREVLHVPALGGNGITGWSPIRLHREAVGLSLATEQYGAAFFGNNSQPGGVLTHPTELSDKAAARIKKSWEDAHRGIPTAHRVALLEEGMKWEQTGIPPEDSQFLETRKFQVSEIARIFRVPPHMIGDLERATFSNIEHQSIDFVVHTITPWLARWEQELNRKLLSEAERGDGLYIKFNVDGLLRGDIKSRYEAYAVGKMNGFLSTNDIRAKEDMNPVDDGDIYLVPMNMVPADEAGDQAGSDGAGSPDTARSLAPTTSAPDPAVRLIEHRRTRSIKNRRRAQHSFRDILLDAARRMVNREVNAARRATSKLEEWIDEFYDGHREFIHDVFGPIFRALMEAIQREAVEEVGGEVGIDEELDGLVESYVDVFATRHIESSKGQLRKIEREAENAVEALAERLDEWRERRPEKIADMESTRAGGAFAKFAYAALGVSVLRWVTFGENCSFCDMMDGRTISIEATFLNRGDALEAGEGQVLPTNRDISHPPLHEGCDCMIVSGD